jgi:hypothetical protein
MPEQNAKLNSLSRCLKRSDRLILEAQDHCEVPAGCGGVVLHWRNPNQGIPLTFRLYAGGPYQFFLDGEPLSSARPVVAFGEHVLSMLMQEFEPSGVVLLFAAVFEDKTDGKGHEERAAAKVTYFLSAPDSSWKYTVAEPPDAAWQRIGYDDSGWSTMPGREWPQEPKNTKSAPNAYHAEQLVRLGAKGLGVNERPVKIWIRRTFPVQPPH